MPDITPAPAVFVGHGSPMTALSHGPAARFFESWGPRLAECRAILVATAHWTTAEPRLGAAARPATYHDFFGFPPALHAMRYPAPGAPEVARQALGLLHRAGMEEAAIVPDRPLDHGVWVPLIRMLPEAQVPVVPLSVQPQRDARYHVALGRALAPLRREGVAILGSGALTHDLRSFRGQDEAAPVEPWAAAFADWFAEAIAEGRLEDLFAWRERAPEAARNHPTPEHLMPLFVALGAGMLDGPAAVRPEILHRSQAHGFIAMDAFAF